MDGGVREWWWWILDTSSDVLVVMVMAAAVRDAHSFLSPNRVF